MQRRRIAPPLLAFGAALTAVLCSMGLVLAAATVTPATTATSDLYAGCNAGAGTGQAYENSEVEPYGAVNAADTSNIVTVFQQDRWDNGGARGLAASVTRNGGTAWHVVALPFSSCAPNSPADLKYQRASDPWVSFGPGSPDSPSGTTAYAVSISFNQSPGNNGNTVGAAVSYDGGWTWVHAQSLRGDATTGVPLPVPDSNFQYFHDKESVTADPTLPGRAYAIWDVLIGPNANIQSNLHSGSFTDFTLLSITTDYGETWTPARVINDSAHPTTNKNQTIGNIIVIDARTGTLYDFFDQIYNTGSNAGGGVSGAKGDNVAFQKSIDHGASWTASQVISPLLTVGVADPNNVDPRTNSAPAPLRTADSIPAPAIDSIGNLVVVWQDARFTGHDEIVISMSQDGGATWLLPQRVSNPTGQPAFTGSVAVSSSGTVGVTYYQFDTTSRGSMPTNYFIKTFANSAIVTGGIDRGVTPTLVAGPFNMLDAPFALGYFTGDYQALLARGSTFVPVFVQGTCGLSQSCRALTSVTPPADTTPTKNNATDVYVGTGF